MQKFIALFVVLLNVFPLTSYAISARSCVLIDSSNGRILYEKNAHEKLPMASTTKIMTGLLACESGKLGESVKTSAFASGTEGSSLWLKIGERQTLENLTYGLLLKSGNDAAVAIAEHLGGSTEAFALLMNKKAREAGAENTNFKNPHGLDCDGHYTTAYDLAIIAYEAMKNEKFREIVSTKTYTIPMEGEKWDRALKNHNKLLWSYDGCNGIKTGFTKKSGRCLVSSAKKDGMGFICVTLNSPDDWNDHKYLLDYGYSNYRSFQITEKGEKIKEIVVNKKYNQKLDVVAAEDFAIALADNENIKLETKIDKVELPVKKGKFVGKINIYCNGEKIAEVNLVSGKSVKNLIFFEKLIINLKKLVK